MRRRETMKSTDGLASTGTCTGSSEDGKGRCPCNSSAEKDSSKVLAQALQEKLAISDEPTSTPAKLSPTIHISDSDAGNTSTSTRRTIICDLWYGLPTQKRPRRERVNAVARQLRNFECWSSSANAASCAARSSSKNAKYRIVLVGGEADVKVIGERLGKLRMEEKIDVSEECRVQLLPGVTVEDECNALSQSSCQFASDNSNAKEESSNDIIHSDQQAVYLSPDAEHTLNSRQKPPQTVIVGMLIDRRVQPNRSNLRATKINVNAARLPMDELRVDGLENSEALNVDTVLELMIRWWDAADRVLVDGSMDRSNCIGRDADGANVDDSLTRCFLDAASSAMVSHEDRHPNRAIHGTQRN